MATFTVARQTAGKHGGASRGAILVTLTLSRFAAHRAPVLHCSFAPMSGAWSQVQRITPPSGKVNHPHMSQTVLTDTFFTNFDLHPPLPQGLEHRGFTPCTPPPGITLPPARHDPDIAGPAQHAPAKQDADNDAAAKRVE